MNDQEIETDRIAIYIFGRCSALIEDYAHRNQIPASLLAQRVAGLLSAEAGGTVLGVENHLPALRISSPGHPPASTLAKSQRAYRHPQSEKKLTGSLPVKKIIELYQKGYSIKQIQQTVGGSYSGIYYALHKSNVISKPYNYTKYSAKTLALVMKLDKAGLTRKEIAGKTGVKLKSIPGILKRNR